MNFLKIINSVDSKNRTFDSVNFGCRVNAAETNQLSQILIDNGFTPNNSVIARSEATKQSRFDSNPSVILVNTCAITKKGDIESLSRVRVLQKNNPDSLILVTGCANLKKLENIKNVFVFNNKEKEEILSKNQSFYTPKIKDKFSNTNRFLLKVQSGCTANCSYCIVPTKREKLHSLPITDAVKTVNSAIQNNYKEIIITGVNLNLYQHGFSNLLEKILTETSIPLISFGSIPLNCIDEKFINLYQNPKYKNRLSNFLHIPLQSGSNKILKLMHRPYNKEKIIEIFNKLKSCVILNEVKNPAKRKNNNVIPSEKSVIPSEVEGSKFSCHSERSEESSEALKIGTDIIIGFPTESEQDFKETYELCQSIGFSKIHVFKFSPRPNTKAWELYENNPKLSQQILKQRSSLLQKLSSLNHQFSLDVPQSDGQQQF